MSRILRSDEDCADCLCRVCAMNGDNDSKNPLCERWSGSDCHCDCEIGVSELVETEDDCERFLPDLSDYMGFEEGDEFLMISDDKDALLANQSQNIATWLSVPGKRDRICSHCGKDEPYKFADEHTDVYNFCPHCGFRMIGRSI